MVYQCLISEGSGELLRLLVELLVHGKYRGGWNMIVSLDMCIWQSAFETKRLFVGYTTLSMHSFITTNQGPKFTSKNLNYWCHVRRQWVCIGNSYILYHLLFKWRSSKHPTFRLVDDGWWCLNMLDSWDLCGFVSPESHTSLLVSPVIHHHLRNTSFLANNSTT